ncbi:hypothetical protein H2199_004021 [Coniosporium tulheliwenetii]|uniref:Uncharacterized protein n=1 Tax=Coniosporium tulheliwenetii TaxID=3383036 RepID=A0ACC2ZA38_9PEZI|nr:hypothetical protein H2199_004021 [Cladosporium sp. JES 115]
MDDEGNPDVYRNLIDKLKREDTVDEPIMEPMTMDWRAKRESLPAYLDRVSQQPMWMPLVEAGVVGQTPAEEVRIEDLVTEPHKQYQVNYSGYRVEPLPDPNGKDKSLSKQHKYVPLHYIRPFDFWQDFLKGIPEEKWHPTIKHALTVTTTLSFVEKHCFTGTWPTTRISCRALFLGPEFLTLDDTDKTPIDPASKELPRGLEGYEPLYRLYDPAKFLRVPFYRADTRAEALDLETLNSVELAAIEETRDPKAWRACIRVMERVADERDRVEVKKALLAQRPLRVSGRLEEAGVEVAIQEEGETSGVDEDGDKDEDEDEDRETDRLVERLAAEIGFESAEEEEGYSDERELVDEASTPKRQRVEVVI